VDGFLMGKGLIMKGKNREMTMSRYIIHLAAILLALTGLIFLLGCEKEGVTGEKGELVDVVFTIDNGGYEEENTFTRSGNIKGEQTKIVPLKDGLYLAMTLKPAEGDKTRAWEAEDEGKLIMLVAFETGGDGSAVGPVLYKVEGGVLAPDDSDHRLLVETGKEYHFVAYSFNSAVEPTVTNIDPENDLLWGKTDDPVEISAANQEVKIVMGHLFSRVQMVMDVTKIVDADGVAGNAEVKTLNAKVYGGLVQDLNIRTGVLALPDEGDPSAEQPLVFPDLPDEEAESDLRTVTPTYDPLYPQNISVAIDEMVIEIENEGDYTFTNQGIEFDGPVEKGKSYVLQVNLRRTRWAWSNVYWDTAKERMTFDQSAPSENVNTYQGLFFKWGSLVGSAPMGTGTGVTLYVASSLSQGWPTTTVGATNHTYWTPNGDWPYIPSVIILASDWYINYLIDITDVATLKGDICAFIDDEWRMPTIDEFGAETDFGSFISGSSSSDVYGTGSISNGRVYNSAFGSVFLPASGQRLETWNYFEGVGTTGLYWTSTLITGAEPQLFGFNSTEVAYEHNHPSCSLPIRCIRKLSSELQTP
jgi:hypothetical protein